MVLLPATSTPVPQLKPHRLSRGSLQSPLVVLSARPLAAAPPSLHAHTPDCLLSSQLLLKNTGQIVTRLLQTLQWFPRLTQSKSQSPYGNPQAHVIPFLSATSLEQNTPTPTHTHTCICACYFLSLEHSFPSYLCGFLPHFIQSVLKRHAVTEAFPAQRRVVAQSASPQISILSTCLFQSTARYVAPDVSLLVALRAFPHHTRVCEGRNCVGMAAGSSAPSTCYAHEKHFLDEGMITGRALALQASSCQQPMTSVLSHPHFVRGTETVNTCPGLPSEGMAEHDLSQLVSCQNPLSESPSVMRQK